MVPRNDGDNSAAVRPFDISGSDIDLLMELNPEGKVGGISYIIFRLETISVSP